MLGTEKQMQRFKEELLPNIKELVNIKVNGLRKEIENGAFSTNAYPTKLDKIAQYLTLLYEAQKADHRVDKEIEEALKLYRAEAGI